MIDEEINLDIINIETNVSSGPNVESSITTGMNITDVGIGGPRGEKGDKGDTGSQGAKGDTGATGPQGPQGIQGEKGEKGDKGDKGEKGDTGATGPQGPQGEKGTKGDQGIQGPKGDTGPQGPQGEKGDTGAKGDKGDKGDTGPQGPQGEKGDTGDVSDVKIAGTSVVSAGVASINYADSSTGGVVKTNTNYGTNVDSNGSLRGTTKTYEDYGSMHNLGLISKVTLENVIEGKNLVSNTDYGSFATAGVIKASSTYGTQFASTGAMYAQTKTYEQYTDSTSPGLFIGKGTLENVIEGKGLVSNTDYADAGTGGVIKTGSSYGTTMSASGNLRAVVKTYEDYSSAGDYMLVGKGTLENVITGKGLVDQTALAGKQDTLTAGTGINITNNVISATGGGTVSGETIYYGVSSSSGTGQAKTVTVDNGFTLHDGAAVRVLFANGQTYSGAPTLNVNSTGAKTIQYKSGTNAMKYIWTSGQVVDFVYRKSSDVWIMVMGGLASTSYYGITKLASSTTSTTTSAALTPYSLNAVMANIITGYPVYSSSSTYAVGDRVRYGWFVYECTTAITTAESWDENHWTEVDALQTQIDTLEGSLASVATSGSYNDLSNKPAIPTVNNSTITVTNNGKTVGTFTTNASSAVTIALKTQHTSWGAYHEL